MIDKHSIKVIVSFIAIIIIGLITLVIIDGLK